MPRIRQGASGLRDSVYTVDEINQGIEGGLGAHEALAISLSAENEDFTFTESLEDFEGGGATMDDEDGVTANWSSEVTKRVRVLATAVVDEGSSLGAIGTTELDEVDLVIFVNEVTSGLSSDEGPSDVHEGTTTFNIDGVLDIAGQSTIRLVLETDALATSADYDVAAAGELDLVAVD